MKKAYTTLAKYYDLLYQDKDYRGEVEFIKKIIKKRAPRAKSVLDVGCGTGNHLNLLLRNFEVLYGVDLNPEALKEARKKSPKVKYFTGGMTDFAIGRKFEVITCLFSVFNYNLSAKDAQKTLQNIKSHLEKKGLVIFALYLPRNTKKETKLHFGKNSEAEVTKINQFVFDPKTSLETSDFIVLIKDKKGTKLFPEKDHQCRIYEVDKFSEMLTKAGFVNIEVFDDFTDKPVSKETKYPVFAANLG